MKIPSFQRTRMILCRDRTEFSPGEQFISTDRPFSIVLVFVGKIGDPFSKLFRMSQEEINVKSTSPVQYSNGRI